MKTLHLYLTRQILASLALTSVVFTLVLLLANLLKEILSLLINKQATLGVIGEAVALLVPFVWTFALPMGMLTATLLVFGRFSADQELTAARASGVSLLSLIAPVLVVSLLLCVLSAWMNMNVSPRAWLAYRDLLRNFKVNIATAQLPEHRLIKDLGPDSRYMLWIENNEEGHLKGVTVYALDDKKKVTTYLVATTGELQYDAVSNLLNLELFDVKGNNLDGSSSTFQMPTWKFDPPIDLNKRSGDNSKPGLAMMTYAQLRQELHDLEDAMTVPLNGTNVTAANLIKLKQEFARQKPNITLPVRVQMNQQVAMSFACFGFTLIGIPLGIRMHRRETNIGAAMALLLAFIYYSFVLAGQAFNTRPELAPQFIVWLPNFIFQAVGIVLLWRVNRGI